MAGPFAWIKRHTSKIKHLVCSLHRMLDVFDSHGFNPLCAPGRRGEWVSKVLGFMRHFSIPKLHNAQGGDTLAFVHNHVLSDPKISLSYDAADRKAGRLARMMTTKRLQV